MNSCESRKRTETRRSQEELNGLHRLLSVEGSLNLRDLGGYPSNAYPKARTRKGVVYRSGTTHNITEQGWQQMKRDLNINTIVDLRLKNEFNDMQISDSGIEHFDIPLVLPLQSVVHRFEQYCKDDPHNSQQLLDSYLSILENNPQQIKKILQIIQDRPGQGILIHCSLGKDRTGIISAIILLLAGVPSHIIVDDYFLSQEALKENTWMLKKGISQLLPNTKYNGNVIENLVRTEKERMVLTLNAISSRYGGIRGFLGSHCKIPEANLDTLQDLLLQDNASKN